MNYLQLVYIVHVYTFAHRRKLGIYNACFKIQSTFGLGFYGQTYYM